MIVCDICLNRCEGRWQELDLKVLGAPMLQACDKCVDNLKKDFRALLEAMMSRLMTASPAAMAALGINNAPGAQATLEVLLPPPQAEPTVTAAKREDPSDRVFGDQNWQIFGSCG